MATQSSPQEVPSPVSAIPHQAVAQPRPVAGQGDSVDAGAVQPSLPVHGAMSMVATGNPRHNDALTSGEIKSEDKSQFLRISAPAERLLVGLLVSVPVRGFRVRNLLTIAPDELIETQWGNGDDLPLSSGDVQLAWTEFEVVDTRLAVRVTRLA